jgi:hypothetical protein
LTFTCEASNVYDPHTMWKKPAGNLVAWERTVVGDHVDPETGDPSALGAHLRMHDVVAGEAVADQVLRAILDPLDRAAGDDRTGDRADVPRIDRDLAAEAAADVRADDPDHVLGKSRHLGVDRAVGVGGLVAVVDVQLAGVRVEVGDHPARLERGRVAPGVDDVPGDHGVRRGEDPVGGRLVAGLPVRAGQVVALTDLVVADQRGIRVERLAGVDDDRERLVLDVDEGDGVACRVLVEGDDEGDLLMLEADLVAREHGLRVVGDGRHPGEAERLEVLGGDDRRDLGMRERRRGVDRDDLGVGVGAVEDRSVHHPGKPDVVEVAALAADEAGVFLALQAPEADGPLRACARKVLRNCCHAQLPWVGAPSYSAAHRTAETMFL